MPKPGYHAIDDVERRVYPRGAYLVPRHREGVYGQGERVRAKGEISGELPIAGRGEEVDRVGNGRRASRWKTCRTLEGTAGHSSLLFLSIQFLDNQSGRTFSFPGTCWIDTTEELEHLTANCNRAPTAFMAGEREAPREAIATAVEASEKREMEKRWLGKVRRVVNRQ